MNPISHFGRCSSKWKDPICQIIFLNICKNVWKKSFFNILSQIFGQSMFLLILKRGSISFAFLEGRRGLLQVCLCYWHLGPLQKGWPEETSNMEVMRGLTGKCKVSCKCVSYWWHFQQSIRGWGSISAMLGILYWLEFPEQCVPEGCATLAPLPEA